MVEDQSGRQQRGVSPPDSLHLRTLLLWPDKYLHQSHPCVWTRHSFAF